MERAETVCEFAEQSQLTQPEVNGKDDLDFCRGQPEPCRRQAAASLPAGSFLNVIGTHKHVRNWLCFSSAQRQMLQVAQNGPMWSGATRASVGGSKGADVKPEHPSKQSTSI